MGLMGSLGDSSTTDTALPVNKSGSNLRKRARLTAWVVATVVVAACGAAIILHRHSPSSDMTLPSSITGKITRFHVYYIKPSFSTDFVLQRTSVSYQNGVLVFNMKNPVGKTLVFTEQATPPNFDPSSQLQTTSQSATEFGQTYISDDPDRTVGTLFSADKTWIVVNAPNPVGGDLMKQILQALTPLTLIK